MVADAARDPHPEAPADAARISSFSSLGPSSDYSIKPDLLAIGENLSTARPVSQGGYVVEGGTSFSAPAVAGAAALLIAASPALTPLTAWTSTMGCW